MPDMNVTFCSSPSPIDEVLREFIDDRVIVFNQEVDDTMIENVAINILKWNKEDKDIPVDKRKKIRFLISSVGGDSFVSMNIVDVIMQSKTPVIGIGLDLVASAGYHVFLACHERYAFNNSVFLQHDGTVTVSNSTRKAQDAMRFFSDRESNIKNFTLSRTKMTEEFYDSIYDSEYYMTAKRAKELGVVEKIIGEDIDIDELI